MVVPVLSLVLRACVALWAVFLARQYRDPRLALLAIAAAILAGYDAATLNDPDAVLRLTITVMTVITVIFTGRIVGARHQNWERTRAVQRLNQAVLDNVTDAVFLTDEQGSFTHVWPTFLAVFGISPQQALEARTIHNLFGMDLVDQDELRATGEVSNVEHRLGGERNGRWVLVSARMTDIDGRAVLYSSRDISGRKQAEIDLLDAHAQVEALKDRLQAENLYLQEELRLTHNFDEIVGNSPAIMQMLSKVEQVAQTDATVLILGETGSGKELVARAIHNLSSRRDRPLVKLNCAALPHSLIESELFGHEKGAFTGAVSAKAGRFEIADRGTAFLDEIGEVQIEVQAKLLRVLQEGELQRVGSNTLRRVDVRLLAATNRNLDEAVRNGEFRADLFYRLNVFPITVPPLRERKQDIPLLANVFLNDCAQRIGRQFSGFNRASLDRMMAYSWPGNVRELQNVIERAAILSRGGIIDVRPELMRVDGQLADRTLHAVERQHIETVLREAGWVIEGPAGAARILGLHPNTLRSRMKRLGIERPPASRQV